MNTANNPKTIFEIPGTYCELDMKLPVNPIVPGRQFHSQLLEAKNKAQVIDILCHRGSQQGWFSDMPEGLFDKLQGMRTSPFPQKQ